MRVSEIRVKRIRVNQGLGVPKNHMALNFNGNISLNLFAFLDLVVFPLILMSNHFK